VQETPFLGASPDGLTMCECHGRGIVEIKCPTAKDNYVDSSGVLPREHTYNYQIQTTMMVVSVEWCDLYVYRPQSQCICIRVKADKDLQANIINKAELYFKQIVLPELVSRKFSSLTHVLGERGQHQRKIYVCQKPLSPSDKVVICSVSKCSIRVYHLLWVGLMRAVKTWNCENCRKS